MNIVTFIFAVLINFVQSEKNIFCFYHYYQNDVFNINNINPNLCTHVVYDFYGISPQSGKFTMMKSGSNWNHNNETNIIKQLQELKSKNRKIKILVSAGYWDISKKYSEMARDSKKRKIFIESAFKYVNENNFDGLDISWKWPGKLSGDTNGDIEHHANLIFELSLEKLKQRRPLILTAIVNPIPYYAKLSYKILEIANHLDFIILAAYDMHGHLTKTGLGSPIFQNYHVKSILLKSRNIENVLKFWIVQQGIPTEKLILGISTYGNAYILQNSNQTKPGSMAKFPGQPYKWTVYNELCIKLKTEPWIIKWDNFVLGEYANNGKYWIEFDNLKSVELKTRLANEYKLGGVMLNSIKYDDYLGNCGSKHTYPLLRTINSIFNNKASFPEFEYVFKIDIIKVNVKHHNYTQSVYNSEQSTFLQ